MYSGDDLVPNYTRPKQPGINATLLARAPFGAHQSVSNFRPDGFACNCLLGKGCTALDYCTSDSSCMHANTNANSQKQKLAMHVNTRHMAMYHPGRLYPQHDISPPAQVMDFTNQSFAFQKPQLILAVGGNSFQPPLETSSIENAVAFASMEMDVSSQSAIENTNARDTTEANVQSSGQNNLISFNTSGSTLSHNTDAHTSNVVANDNASCKVKPMKSLNIFLPKVPKKPSAILSKTTLPTSSSNHGVHCGVATNNQVVVSHMNIRDAKQVKFLKRVKSWANALKCIRDAYKQQLEYELFGDELTLTANVPDLLELLKDIDQKKNKLTHEEERATSLMQAIFDVLKYCGDSTDKEIIRLASNILDNLGQRFRGLRFRRGRWMTV